MPSEEERSLALMLDKLTLDELLDRFLYEHAELISLYMAKRAMNKMPDDVIRDIEESIKRSKERSEDIRAEIHQRQRGA